MLLLLNIKVDLLHFKSNFPNSAWGQSATTRWLATYANINVTTGFLLYAYLKNLIVAKNVAVMFVGQILSISYKIVENQVGRIVRNLWVFQCY